ncbi:MAG: hypothetical protein H7Z40_14940 [Phycisphaerae bacterium]|nr:hypothetical protein [Gemmatimonadaceae bacterium]
MDPELKAAYARIRAREMQARERLFLEFPTFSVTTVSGPEGSLLPAATVTAWHRAQRIFSFDHQGQDRYPAFQFDAGLSKPIVGRVLQLVRPENGWHAMFWFAAANAWLDGDKSPVELLDVDPDAVAEAAQHANDQISD